MAGIKHLLIIRFSAMGDVAMTVPVIKILRETYPELKITVLSRGFFKPMFSGIPNINFLEADVKGKHRGLKIFKLASQAKTLGVDAVADLHEVLRTKLLKLYFKLHGIPVKSIDKGRKEKKLLTSGNPVYFKPLKSTHQRYADVFEALGFPISLDKINFSERKRLTPKLSAIIGVEEKILLGIAPFAAHQGKMYPMNLMQKVLSELDCTGKYKILLFGGGKKEIDQLKKWETPSGSITSVAGKLSFEEELLLISHLDGMVSMDSGNGHLAAIYDVPVITIWGVTHPFAGFVPFQQNENHQLTADKSKYPAIPTSIYGNKFPSGYENAMRTIQPEQIIQKIKEVIEKGNQ